MKNRFRTATWTGLLLAFVALAGCTTLRQVTALRNVTFGLDRVAQAQLAGIDLRRVQSYEDLRATDMLRLGAAVADGELPLSFTVHVNATNPESNSVAARLTKMDWTLILDGETTVSGVFNNETLIEPGTTADVPVPVQLDLVKFFGNGLQDLVDLALAVGGEGPPQNVKLQVQPTIRTALGRIKYPQPITVMHESVGGTTQPAQ
ncbi:NDR1/HIN1-like protein [Salisaeta longa]|uniref:NDR1/HIN1-like protein n=1 Tax=Salisaeta longa TaxID=503170 RepID=UPI0003B66AC2|nr:LEA type 2 family protein [Salisaeta longa]